MQGIGLFFCFLLTFSFSAQGANIPVPAAPKLAASSWVLLDHGSNQVLAQHNADKRIEPASITKIMTSYVVYQALEEGLISMDDQVQISEKAWRMKGSRMFIEVNKWVSVKDLVYGMVIQSGNDAAVALAEHVAGSEEAFADQMNATAQRLGMLGSHFVNVTGWPNADHYTTAKDVSVLSRALINDFPKHYAIYGIKEFTYNSIKQPNRNRLLWRDSSVDGLKTGHTDAAGYCLAASAKRGDMRLISVVMGTSSDSARAKYSQTLLNYGFRYYETHKLYSAGDSLRQVRVWKGDKEQLDLGPATDLFVTIPRGQYKNLKPSLENIPVPVEAPVLKASEVGLIQVALDGEVIASTPAVALQQIEEGSFFSQALDTILLLFEYHKINDTVDR
jgi:D-alanyl-D-alanine carboxypeptidase (penicillin-binding protein 5/6)